jgi:uncharacterized membrane protein YdjX (TVP38/TMEM64 family)
MKKYWIIALFLATFFLLTFGLITYLNVPLLNDPAYLLNKGGIIAAVGGVLLLISDILLPVPGSLVMIGNGALFGVGAGTLLSMLGGISASMIGFWMGKKGDKVIRKYTTEKERSAAERIMNKWGILAVIVTRPIPILSETVSIMAGTASLNWKQMFLASFFGLLPGAFIYALAGAKAFTADNGVYSFLIVLLIAGIFWLAGKRLRKIK